MNRAVYYKSNGDPVSVLSAISLPKPPSPNGTNVNLKVLLAPINPSDINAVQGIYPNKPTATKTPVGDEIYIPGNEGLAEVDEVGPEVKGLQKGDWVIFSKKQAGTWSSGMVVTEPDVIKVDKAPGLTEVHAATLSVNPSTAYNMLNNFVSLKPGDWVMQNGGNSAVGQAVIQIAAARGVNTINFVRKKDNIDELVEYLTSLGATKVVAYDVLEDRSFQDQIKEWTGDRDIQLMFNCVGDKTTTQMLRYLGKGANVITYGAMSKAPLPIPASSLIFQDLVFRGFWQTRWYGEKTREERLKMSGELVNLIQQGKLKEPAHEIFTIPAHDDDEAATKKVKDIFEKAAHGTYGKKVLVKIEQRDA